MMGAVPYGGLNITGGAATVALTTTATLMNIWDDAGGSNGPDSTANQGDPAVKPDYANNRILVQAPGTFLVHLVISGTMTTGADLIAQIRKNGTVYAYLKAKARITTNKDQLVLTGLLVVAAADNPKTIQTFADPSSSGFAGAGGAPKMEVPIDVVVSCAASTDTLTVEEAQLTLIRLG